MASGVDGCEKQELDRPRERRRPGGSRDAHCGKAELSEDQDVVAGGVQHIRQNVYGHRLDDFAGRTHRCAQGKRKGGEHGKCADDLKICHARRQGVGSQPHRQKQGLGIEVEHCARGHPDKQIQRKRNRHRLDEPLALSGAEILRTKDARTDGEELVDQEHEVDELIHHAYRRHRSVAAMRKHDGVDGADKHD